MRSSKILLVDALINLILGVLLAAFPRSVVELLGVPHTDVAFYPSILGAVLIGIAVALVVEYARRPAGPARLGLYGAIAINLCGALFLVGTMCEEKQGCQKPGELKGDPKECSPEQIRKCHGDVEEHPCLPKDAEEQAGEQ